MTAATARVRGAGRAGGHGLARARIEAPRHQMRGGGSPTLNCGFGRGRSVLEAPRAGERTAGPQASTRLAPRPAREALGWRPAFDDLDRVVASALTREWREAAIQRRQLLQA